MSFFDKAFDFIKSPSIEGGYVNDPKDPGGETKFGVSDRADGKIDGMADLDGDGKGDVAIKDLTLPQSKEWYRRNYWAQIKGDFLPWPLNLFVFDAAVNQGVEPAVKMLQKALDCAQDGILGAATMRQAQAATPWHMARFMAFRAMRYQGTKNFDRFGEGWLTRTYLVAMEA